MTAPVRASAFDKAAPALSVVHIVRQYRPNRGGLEDVVANLAREQLRAGWRVRVITLDRLFRKLDETLPARETIDGVDVRRIPFRGSTRYPIAPQVFRHFEGADVVHVHAVDFFFDAMALGRPLHGLPIVATTHGGFFHSGDFSGLKKLWFKGPTRLTASLYDRIVACSASDARAFAPIAPDIALIENGADLDKFAGASSQVPVKRMAALGRFSKNKHPERVIAMMKALVAKDPEWRLDMIGGASDWSVEDLRAMIADVGLGPNVRLHVGLDDTAVAEVLSASSLFVSASDYEGFGVALIEAMSAGLKPVVHPNEAFAGLGVRHPCIRLVDFADAAASSEAVRGAHRELVENPAAALPTAAELAPYAWTEVAARYGDAYRAAIARRGRATPDSKAAEAAKPAKPVRLGDAR